MSTKEKHTNSKKYKILYIGKFKPFSTETKIADELEKLGHRVVRFNLQRDIHIAINDSDQFDFALFGKLPHEWKNFIGKCKCRTICWTFDLYPCLGRTLNDTQLKADLVISTGGVPNTEIVRQGIPEEEKVMLDTNYKYDVAFVGSIYTPERVRLHQFLAKKYGNWYIKIGDNVEVRGMDLNKFISEVKIVVGDSLPTDNYWSNRVYEICGRGGFLLHPRVKGMNEEWRSNKDIVYFERDNFEDLEEKIEYYLKHDKEREKIRKSGFKRCPTYKQRVQEFLCKI